MKLPILNLLNLTVPSDNDKNTKFNICISTSTPRRLWVWLCLIKTLHILTEGKQMETIRKNVMTQLHTHSYVYSQMYNKLNQLESPSSRALYPIAINAVKVDDWKRLVYYDKTLPHEEVVYKHQPCSRLTSEEKCA